MKTDMPKIVGIADTCHADTVSVGINYSNAVLRAGNIPMILPYTEDVNAIRSMMKHVDALLLPGGGSDVDPSRYHAKPSPLVGEIVSERDAFESHLLAEAVALRRPVLGICRGLQIVNVFFGGSLYQDLPTEYPSPLIDHQRPDLKWGAVHDIRIAKDSKLYEMLRAETIGVNSTHHQSCRDIARDFVVTATTDDGVVEAIESQEFPIVAVQFHPERLLDNSNSPFLHLFEF